MPKIHDLCQQFWEEISLAEPQGSRSLNPEEIVEVAHSHLQKYNRENADVIISQLLFLAEEMNMPAMSYDAIDQLVYELFRR